MRLLLLNGTVFHNGQFEKSDCLIDQGYIIRISENLKSTPCDMAVECGGKYIIPGFVDVHTHLREPAFSLLKSKTGTEQLAVKETIDSGTAAALRGGYTAVCSMPNVVPAPDCGKNLSVQLDIIKKSANVKVYPFGTITKNRAGSELSAMSEMAGSICGLSDDGSGVGNGDLMKSAFIEAKKLGLIIAAHCEDTALIKPGGVINDGEYAKKQGFVGISSESEYKQLERDIALTAKVGNKYHACHISTRQSVELVRRAKQRKIDITCETAPHYLIFCDDDLTDDGRFKMNPPLRSANDRAALIEGIRDGTIEIIATDHAPHTAAEKAGGLKDSLMGIPGLESAFGVLYTKLVMTKIITLEALIKLMTINPRRRFNLPGGVIRENEIADITVLDLDNEYIFDTAKTASLGKASPFDGMKLFGRAVCTIVDGEIKWNEISR